ncbi:hypothetical protein NP493_1912g00000 [Ridgeia piscesae]|uniref:Uncharacterized protein n=1 Tax=Ridgeia piscesae TaxID=27915 RepID=A0AAD9JR42_RIDPI|nr:hypothetical protein NP493_1912g00000 [Ridgeia piscesae]
MPTSVSLSDLLCLLFPFTVQELQFAIVEGLAKIRLDMGYSDTQLDDSSRQYAWERGHIDYRGIDSFDNIRRQLDKVLSDPKLNAGASKGN